MFFKVETAGPLGGGGGGVAWPFCPRCPRWPAAPRTRFQIPERSGFPSAVRGAGAGRFGFPSGFRGTPASRNAGHCANAGSASTAIITNAEIKLYDLLISISGSVLRRGCERFYSNQSACILQIGRASCRERV